MSTNVLLFAGQGTVAINSSLVRQQAIIDASLPLNALLLSSCHEAFHQALSSLSPFDLVTTDVVLSDFKTPQDLVGTTLSRYTKNPVISGSTLFLVQALRYLAYASKNQTQKFHIVLGFSSGVLLASAVAASNSSLDFLSHALEAYRLALWVGIRAKIDTMTHRAERYTNFPWSITCNGIASEAMNELVEKFNTTSSFPLSITAVLDPQCVVVSGRPDVLEDFSTTIPCSALRTTLDALYHSPIQTDTVRNQVLNDIITQSIQFPKFRDLEIPILSTFTGEVLDSSSQGTLVEMVVNMIITQPIHWNLVVQTIITKALPSIHLHNIGPGLGLAQRFERAFSEGVVTVLDLTHQSGLKEKPQKHGQEGIAIVGMAVHMPGARDHSQLWDLLERGINTVSEIPEHRFKVSDYIDRAGSTRQMRTRTGNFIDGVDEFDHEFFKISPREARSMDPQQRIVLHAAYTALENSGYVSNATPTSRPDKFGCYVGSATQDYIQNLKDDIDVCYYRQGTFKACISSRVAHAMQFSGPSMVFDTACSSSAVALYQACRAILNGDCCAALAGGVNTISSPDMTIGLERGHFLSPTGQCKPFDASADGYSRSEGVGMFVLKRLSDAIAEDDHIWGVIRGIEVNQSGLARSITHPHSPTQAALFRQVLNTSGIDPHRVNVVEAHGTGTQAGDPRELESIRAVFAVNRRHDNPLHITSIKCNIGHLEAASGAAGLAKLLLMLKHRTIPRVISLTHLNPEIAPLESDNTVIDIEQAPWKSSHSGMATRIAFLNNFGAAGSNAALILEEHCHTPRPEVTGMPLVFGCSAKTESDLVRLRNRYVEWLKSPASGDHRLCDIAYTMTARRQLYPYRMAVYASTKEELINKLEETPSTVVCDTVSRSSIAFVFSKEGKHHQMACKTLCKISSVFSSYMDECDAIITSTGHESICPCLGGDADTFIGSQGLLSFSIQYALAMMWQSWGVNPVAVAGQGVGELVALVIAGVINLREGLTLVVARECLSNSTSPLTTVGDITLEIGQMSFKSPAIPVISAALGQLIQPGDAAFDTPGSVTSFLESTLKRCPIHRLSLAISVLWIDIDTHPHLPLISPTVPIASNPEGMKRSSWSNMTAVLAELFVMDADLKWRGVFLHLAVQCIELPNYPLARTKFWVPFKETEKRTSAATHMVSTPDTVNAFKMLHLWERRPSRTNDNIAIFHTPISHLSDFMQGHMVGKKALCPASVYIEQILEGLEMVRRHKGFTSRLTRPVLCQIEFTKPLVYAEGVARTMILTIFNRETATGAKFQLSSRVAAVGGTEAPECTHMQGEYRLESKGEMECELQRSMSLIAPRVDRILQHTASSEQSEIFSKRTIYEVIFNRVVKYAPQYRTIESLTVTAGGLEATADVQLPKDHSKGPYVAHPVLIDTLLHAAGFMVNLKGSMHDAYICTALATVSLLTERVDPAAKYLVYCNLNGALNEDVVVADAYAITQGDDRTMVAMLQGISFRRVRLESLKRSLEIAAGEPAQKPPQAPRLSSRRHTTAHLIPPPPLLRTADPLDNVQTELIKIISDACGTSTTAITLKTNLKDIGVDSLMFLEIIGRLQSCFRTADIQGHTFLQCQTVADFAREVSTRITRPQMKPTRTPRKSSYRPTLAAIPAQPSGLEPQVLQLVSKTCDVAVNCLNIKTDLSDLGVDSLMIIELVGTLQDEFPLVEINSRMARDWRTCGDIVRSIESILGS